MKKLPLKIEHMDQALAALNDALQQACALMYEKASHEAKVDLSISMEMRDNGAGWLPTIKYRTAVSVPSVIRNVGIATNASQVRWDDEDREFVIMVEGEQMAL